MLSYYGANSGWLEEVKLRMDPTGYFSTNPLAIPDATGPLPPMPGPMPAPAPRGSIPPAVAPNAPRLAPPPAPAPAPSGGATLQGGAALGGARAAGRSPAALGWL